MSIPRQPRMLYLRRHRFHGRDVAAIQHALHRAGFRRRRRRITGTFGEGTDAEIRRFQHHHHLTVDGIVGPHTYAALSRFFDRRARWLLNHFHVHTLSVERLRVLRQTRLMLATAPDSYTEDRPMVPLTCPPPQAPSPFDCSTMVTWVYHCAEVPDPNGYGYDGWGSTWSMLGHGHQVAKPRPGDLVFYSSPAHVGVYVGAGVIVSHGSPGGPRPSKVYYRSDLQEFRSYLP